MSAARLQQARQLHQQGRLADAEALYRDILRADARHFDTLHSLGILEAQRQHFAEAADLFDRAIETRRGKAPAHVFVDCGHVLLELGRAEEARARFERALAQEPNSVEANNGRGVALWLLKRAAEAVTCFDRALRTAPQLFDAHNSRALALLDLDRPADALAGFDRALALAPDSPDAHSNRAAALLRLKRPGEALASCERALRLKPDYAQAWVNLGTAHLHLDRPADALPVFDRALALAPAYAPAHFGRIDALRELGRFDEALESYARALQLEPGNPEALNNRGYLLASLNRLSEAIESYRAAIAVNPEHVAAYNNLGLAYQACGEIGAAMAAFGDALARSPGFAEAYSNLLFADAYNGISSAADYLARARGWEAACVGKGIAPAHMPACARAGRKLRVGYVSGDFRRHAVSFFMEQLLREHDRSRIELFAYSAFEPLPGTDPVNARLREMVPNWVVIKDMDDDAARRRIADDGIDVLVDLAGHSANQRLGVFARRAAPVQAHYLGYFASTGISGMDYWIGDTIVTPAEMDSGFSERIWRLPRVWVAYAGAADAPVPAWRPAADGRIRLGSFNNLPKLNPATLDRWAEILGKLPEAVLVLKTGVLSDGAVRARIAAEFAARGVGADRIELRGTGETRAWRDHMASYDEIDIALDPVGAVGGGTTTCDALWMAVPVVTLEGERMASRMTASMLDAIGRREWIARSGDEYVARAVALARDVDLRARLRATQRAEVAASTLCDARGMARALEDAYHGMFGQALERSRAGEA